MLAGSAGAQEAEAGVVDASRAVLVAPVQGSESIADERRARVADAVERALEARGYAIVAGKALLGSAVVACRTPECIEQNLDAAEAELAIVPALWARESGEEELTLTLLRRAGRNLNVSGSFGEDPAGAAGALVDVLLEKRAALAPPSAPAADAGLAAEPDPGREAAPKHPHAWKAGPIVLIAGGTAAFVAIGVGAAVKQDDQQLDASAVAAWSAVGAAAIAGGTAWWVVGAKRRRPGAEGGARRAPVLAVHPTRIDLRLRF